MKVRVPAITIASVILLCAAGGAARAGGFADGVVGIASPLGDNDYDNFDASPKIGVHIGSWLREQDHVLLGVELGADLTFLDGPNKVLTTELSYHRVRALAGVRIAYDVSKMVRVSARMAVGADYTRFHSTTTILNTTTESTASNVGLAIDPSVALQLHIGSGSYGVQLGLPVGTHNGKDSDAAVNYTSYDFDFLFVAGVDLD